MPVAVSPLSTDNPGGPTPTSEATTFALLPPEIKDRIVHWAQTIGINDESYVSPFVPPIAKATLRALASTDKELNAHAARYLWANVSFQDKDVPALQFFADRLLPRYGASIRRVFFPSDVTPFHSPGPRFTLDPVHDTTGPERRRLYVRIVKALPSLQHVHLELRMPSGPVVQPARARWPPQAFESEPELPRALGAIGEQLRSLEVFGADATRRDAVQLARFLVQCPNLTRLSLRGVDKCEGTEFLEAIWSLHHLEELDLSEVMAFNTSFGDDARDEHGESRWKAPLRQLSLHSLDEADTETYSRFASHFESTLADLFVIDNRALPAPATACDLPHLTQLAIWSDCSAVAFLEAFSASPLEHISISGDPDRAEYENLEPLKCALRQVAGRLQLLELELGIDAREIKELGRELGFAVKAEEVEEDFWPSERGLDDSEDDSGGLSPRWQLIDDESEFDDSDSDDVDK